MRYARHTMLPEVGEAGQVKLLKSKVLLPRRRRARLAVGPVPGGGGRRHARLRRRRRRRRVQPAAADPARAPTASACPRSSRRRRRDRRAQPRREGGRPTRTRLTSENVLDIIKDYDVIVDGADNFPTRYLLNDAALKLEQAGRPRAASTASRARSPAFIPDEGPCYRCLYPAPPPPDMAPSCQEAGVLGVLPGVIGVLQATEAIKLAARHRQDAGRPAAHATTR